MTQRPLSLPGEPMNPSSASASPPLSDGRRRRRQVTSPIRLGAITLFLPLGMHRQQVGPLSVGFRSGLETNTATRTKRKPGINQGESGILNQEDIFIKSPSVPGSMIFLFVHCTHHLFCYMLSIAGTGILESYVDYTHCS